MIFSNQQLKNMAYRAANLGILPKGDYVLDEKKIMNGYKSQKYNLNEKIGNLNTSLAEYSQKMELIKGKLSKEVAARNRLSTHTIDNEIATLKTTIKEQKRDIKNHIRRCQLNGDVLKSTFSVDEITALEDFEPPKAIAPKEESKKAPKKISLWALYFVEVLFILGEGILFYNILTETHDLPMIVLRSIFFIPIVFAASFLTSKRISLRWVWLPILLIVGVYAILAFTVIEWFIASKALEETLTFSAFFIKNGFLILGAVMMVTLALFLTNAVKSMYRKRTPKKAKETMEITVEVEQKEQSPQQLDLDFKFSELRGSYRRLRKLENDRDAAEATGKEEFQRILKDVAVLEGKTEEIAMQIGDFEIELETLEINSKEEVEKYREHFEKYSNENRPAHWKAFDFGHL